MTDAPASQPSDPPLEPLAEDDGLILPIGLYLSRRSATQLAAFAIGVILVIVVAIIAIFAIPAGTIQPAVLGTHANPYTNPYMNPGAATLQWRQLWASNDPEYHATAGAYVLLELTADRNVNYASEGADRAEPVPGESLSRFTWCWPVDAKGNPMREVSQTTVSTGPPPAKSLNNYNQPWTPSRFPQLSYRGQAGVVANAAGEFDRFWLGSTQNPAFYPGSVQPARRDYGSNPSDAGREVVEVAFALLTPLEVWFGASQEVNPSLPKSFPEIFEDLRVRPIDGKLAALVKKYGPIELHRHKWRDIVDLRLWDGTERIVVRWTGPYVAGGGMQSSTLYSWSEARRLRPPTTDLEPWVVIDEGTLGPEVKVVEAKTRNDPASSAEGTAQ